MSILEKACFAIRDVAVDDIYQDLKQLMKRSTSLVIPIHESGEEISEVYSISDPEEEDQIYNRFYLKEVYKNDERDSYWVRFKSDEGNIKEVCVESVSVENLCYLADSIRSLKNTDHGLF